MRRITANCMAVLLALGTSSACLAWDVLPIGNSFDNGFAMEQKATAPIDTWIRKVTPLIHIQCGKKGGRITVWLDVDTSLTYNGDLRSGTVRYRFDGGKPVSEAWSQGDKSGSYQAPNPARILAAMDKAQSMDFEITPHNSTSRTFTVPLTGFTAALADLRRKCK